MLSPRDRRRLRRQRAAAEEGARLGGGATGGGQQQQGGREEAHGGAEQQQHQAVGLSSLATTLAAHQGQQRDLSDDELIELGYRAAPRDGALRCVGGVRWWWCGWCVSVCVCVCVCVCEVCVGGCNY